MGFPTITDSGRSRYQPMETFPLKGDTVPEGKEGWLLLLDELNSAPQAVQVAAYKMILDRAVGLYPLHEKVYIMSAGNLETDGAIVMPMSSALVSRMAHLEIQIDNESWFEWAYANGIHHYITSFLRFKPSMLYTFNNKKPQEVYASPRTWEMLNKALAPSDFKHPELHNLVSSLIGQGTAYEFLAYIELYGKLPTIEEILDKPSKVKIPKELGTQWALVGLTESAITEDNADKLYEFIQRLPKEMQIVWFKNLRNKEYLEDHRKDWVDQNVDILT